VQVVETPKESLNAPVFKSVNQSVEVTESDNIGFLVALMQAADKDGDSLWYDIIGKFEPSLLLCQILMRKKVKKKKKNSLRR
jgi:hypothetical protein